MSDTVTPLPGRRRAAPRCTICGKPAKDPFTPFCSERCKRVDLNRWFTGNYVISRPATDEDVSREEGAREEGARDEDGEREP
jgi:endogenous inhibitor of DNA gyrase (YacG/DUF329 family)